MDCLFFFSSTRRHTRCLSDWSSAVCSSDLPQPCAELIALGTRLWERLGIASGLRLEINSLGTPESRRAYRERLVEYLHAHEARLDADSRRRLTVNPLRVLDSKNPPMQEVIAGATLLHEHPDPESSPHI